MVGVVWRAFTTADHGRRGVDHRRRSARAAGLTAHDSQSPLPSSPSAQPPSSCPWPTRPLPHRYGLNMMLNGEPWIQDLYGDEVHPDSCALKSAGVSDNEECRGEFDATLEETLHLVTSGAVSQVYRHAWGESKTSRLGRWIEELNGDCGNGYTDDWIDPSSGDCDGWFAYDDRTCDFACLVAEGKILRCPCLPLTRLSSTRHPPPPPRAVLESHCLARSAIVSSPRNQPRVGAREPHAACGTRWQPDSDANRHSGLGVAARDTARRELCGKAGECCPVSRQLLRHVSGVAAAMRGRLLRGRHLVSQGKGAGRAESTGPWGRWRRFRKRGGTWRFLAGAMRVQHEHTQNRVACTRATCAGLSGCARTRSRDACTQSTPHLSPPKGTSPSPPLPPVTLSLDSPQGHLTMGSRSVCNGRGERKDRTFIEHI